MSNMSNDIRSSLRTITAPWVEPLLTQKSKERAAINADVERLGLQRHIRELDEQGYTVVTPEESGVTTEMMDRALNCILDRIETRTGVRPDMETGSTHANVYYPVLWYMLFKDQVFQDMASNEHVMALAAHLFETQDFRFSTEDVLMKGPSANKWGKQQLGLHVDMTPYGISQSDPAPVENISCNALWLITDFNEVEDGVTVFIPGTHNHRRWPKNNVEGEEHSVPVIAPRGSFIVWPGTTWHGALPRTKAGMRVAMTMQYCNRYVHPRNPYQYDVTEEILRQNPPRFARLMGLTDMSGWRDEGIYAHLNELAQAGSQRYIDKKKVVPNSMSLESILFARKRSVKAAT
jgi:ectoine hydroxylase-related dioxygenase (phytanoyl-CoA dioxygenase family)